MSVRFHLTMGNGTFYETVHCKRISDAKGIVLSRCPGAVVLSYEVVS